MRVIAGKHKGRRLKTLNCKNVRPTSGKVKEAMFNMLGDTIIDSNVLDLFAGTGNLGIEALSRGAKHVTFVDSSREALKIIQDNLMLIKEDQNADIICADIFKNEKVLSKISSAHIVFVDPPYKSSSYEEILLTLDKSGIFAPNALIVLETSKKQNIGEFFEGFKLLKSKKYANTRLLILQKEQ